jgi:hypothetical protein
LLRASAELEEFRLAADMIVHEVVGNGNPMGNLFPVKIIRQKDLILRSSGRIFRNSVHPSGILIELTLSTTPFRDSDRHK